MVFWVKSHDSRMASWLLCCWFSLVLFLFVPSKAISQSTNRYVTPKITPHTVRQTCGDSYCNGNCCLDSSEELICCDDTSEDYLWWFWVAFIIFILVASMCFGACCCKIRRTRRHYLIVSQDSSPVITTYGTETVAPIMRGYSPGYDHISPPPAYPQAKLPSYTPVAENKGNPPPYQ